MPLSPNVQSRRASLVLTFHTFLLSERQVIQAVVDLGNEFIEVHHPLRLHPQRAPRRTASSYIQTMTMALGSDPLTLGNAGTVPTICPEWLVSQRPFEEPDIYLRIDGHLAELSALDVDPATFATRAAAIAHEPQPRRALLADSLLVDLARTLKEERERSARLADLRERAAELTHHDSVVAHTLRGRIEAAIAARDGTSAPVLIQKADALVQEELRVLAADARRRSVLQGLASLGYEVSEGMATAWVQGGQVVLRKAANPEYGVELGGGTKSERLQVRAVAFGNGQSPRNAVRDRDIEAVWCSELEQLRNMFSISGGGIEIEQALPVGATPLKLIEDSKRHEERDESKTPRTLQR
jgi:hypothetical protein